MLESVSNLLNCSGNAGNENYLKMSGPVTNVLLCRLFDACKFQGFRSYEFINQGILSFIAAFFTSFVK